MLKLSPDTSHANTIRTLGHVTHATLHKDPMEAKPVLRSIFNELSTFEREAHWGMVGWNDDSAVLSFRGTDSNLEWVQSMSYRQLAWFEGKAHGGFIQVLETVWDLVLAALYDAEVLEKDKTLWVCGHSLGASGDRQTSPGGIHCT